MSSRTVYESVVSNRAVRSVYDACAAVRSPRIAVGEIQERI